MNIATSLFTTFQILGFHRWPGAEAPVEFLASKHRHVFHFKICLGVAYDFKADNRGIEFLQFQTLCLDTLSEIAIYTELGLDFGSRSCEVIAKDLIEALYKQGIKVASVEVSEDGENGAVVTAHL